jgi:phage-related protein
MAILDPIFAILSPIMKLIGDLVGLIMKVLMPSLNYIQSTLGGLAKILTGIFTLDFGMIADGFKGMLNGVITMFDSAKNMLLDVILSPLDGIINLMNLIPGVEIPDVSTSLGEATELPQLAKGGVVTGPTQAIIGEGSEAEAVLPLSKLANMLPSGVAIGDSILNAATAPMRGIMNTIGSIFDQGDIGDALKNPISGLMDTIGGMFNGDSIIDKVSNVATAPLRGIMDTVDGLFSNIKSPISGLMDTVGGMFDGGSSPVSVLSDAIGGIFDNDIGDTLLKTITAPMRAVGNLIPSEGVSSAISSFEEDPTGSIGSVFDSVKENISNVLGGGDENKDDEQLKSLNEKMSQLISLIEKGGDVYIDGAKAGKSMVLATSRMG